MQALSQLSYGPARLYLIAAALCKMHLLCSAFLPHMFPLYPPAIVTEV